MIFVWSGMALWVCVLMIWYVISWGRAQKECDRLNKEAEESGNRPRDSMYWMVR